MLNFAPMAARCRLGTKVKKAGWVIKGTFCERTLTPAKKLDSRSFRWSQQGKSWALTACPAGKWSPGKGRCKVGRKAHKLLTRVGR